MKLYFKNGYGDLVMSDRPCGGSDRGKVQL